MSEPPAAQKTAPPKIAPQTIMGRLGIHARVWLRAVVCGLLAYGFIHLLIRAIAWLKSVF